MSWENFSKITTADALLTDIGTVSKDALINNDISSFSITKVETINSRGLIGRIDNYYYTSDGNMISYCTYDIYPQNIIDNIPLYNSLGQLTYNNITNNKEEDA